MQRSVVGEGLLNLINVLMIYKTNDKLLIILSRHIMVYTNVMLLSDELAELISTAWLDYISFVYS